MESVFLVYIRFTLFLPRTRNKIIHKPDTLGTNRSPTLLGTASRTSAWRVSHPHSTHGTLPAPTVIPQPRVIAPSLHLSPSISLSLSPSLLLRGCLSVNPVLSFIFQLWPTHLIIERPGAEGWRWQHPVLQLPRRINAVLEETPRLRLSHTAVVSDPHVPLHGALESNRSGLERSHAHVGLRGEHTKVLGRFDVCLPL